MKQAAHSLKDVEWPDCADKCSAIEYLGAGECDSVCPFKFENEKVKMPNVVPAVEIPTVGGFFRKMGGDYVYLRMSEGTIDYLGLNPRKVYGVCFTGNVAVMRPDESVVQCDLFDMARNIYKED